MGFILLSKSEDFPNFHFRIMVQMIIAPPMHDAITIMTDSEALEREPEVEGLGREVAVESSFELVYVTVTGPAVLVTIASGGGVTIPVGVLSAGVGVAGGADVDELEEVEVEDVEFVLVEEVVLDEVEVVYFQRRKEKS